MQQHILHGDGAPHAQKKIHAALGTASGWDVCGGDVCVHVVANLALQLVNTRTRHKGIDREQVVVDLCGLVVISVLAQYTVVIITIISIPVQFVWKSETK